MQEWTLHKCRTNSISKSSKNHMSQVFAALGLDSKFARRCFLRFLPVGLAVLLHVVAPERLYAAWPNEKSYRYGMVNGHSLNCGF